MPRAVIVGGGISGLSAAYDLSRAGTDCLLLEKQPHLGGVIRTRSWENCVLEAGPDSFISSKPEALALIRELGLENEVIGSNDHQRTTFIVKHGKLVPLPEGIMMIVPTRVMPMIKSSLLSWPAKLRMGLELFRPPPAKDALPKDRSVAEFVTDHFGQEALDYLAEPLLSGVYGGDPQKLGMAGVLPRFLQMETQYGSLGRAVMAAKKPPSSGGSLFRTLRSGLSRLVEKLSAGVNFRQVQVETIERLGSGFRVRAGGAWLETEQVILACPAWAASGLLRTIDAGLARMLGEISYSSSLTVSLIYTASEFDGIRAGFGFLVPQKERQRLAACTFVGTKFPFRVPDDRVLLRCFFGGVGDEAVLLETDESLVTMAREELRRILGLTAAPIFSSIARWPRSMAQFNVGHPLRVQEIRDRTATIPGLHLAGNAYDGIGIPDCIRTGRMAARQVLAAPRASTSAT